jgi:hypothetical protein
LHASFWMTGFVYSIQCRSDTQTLLAIEQINPAFSRSPQYFPVTPGTKTACCQS